MRILDELDLEGGRVHRIGAADLCELLAISSGMLTQLKHKGIAKHLGRDVYDLTGTVTAYVTHLRHVAAGWGGEEAKLTLTGERARLARAQADAQELKNATLRDELVRAEDVLRQWEDVLRGLRSELLALPSRLRADLGHLTTQDVDAIDRRLRDTLSQIGGHRADDRGDQEDGAPGADSAAPPAAE